MTSVMQEFPNLIFMQTTSSCIRLSTLQMTILWCIMMLILWLHGVPPSLIQLIWTVFISRRWSRKTEQSPLFLNGSLIEAVDCIKYLRISIASDLSCTQHIQSITSKARRLVGLLFQHQPSQSSICTTQVVLNASVAYLATT